MRLSRLAACLLAARLAAPAAAASSGGAEALDFLLLDSGARCVALGGACTVLAPGAAALRYNPAGLSNRAESEASFMHNEFGAGFSQEQLGVALRQGWGLHLDYLSLGAIERTTLSQPGGTGQTFGFSDTVLGAGYGRAFGELRVGAGVKYVREIIEEVTAAGYAVDAGVIHPWPTIPDLTLGAALLNIGPELRYQHAREKLPAQLRLGAAYALSALGAQHTALFDMTKVRSDKVRFGLGWESVIVKALSLRLGFSTQRDIGAGFAAGLGWDAGNWSLDYAFTPLGELGGAHRVSVALRWGRADAPAAAAEDGAALRFAEAERLLRERKWSEAEASLEAARAALRPADPRLVLYHERKGTLALRQGDLAGARTLYVEAIKRAGELKFAGPALADAYAGIGLSLAAERRGPQAVGYLERALALGPSPAVRVAAQAQLKALKPE